MNTSAASSPSSLGLRQRWFALSLRERRAVTLAAVLVGSALLWFWAVEPALKVLNTASERQARLQSQWQYMLDLQAQARALQQATRPAAGATQQQLQALTERLLGSQTSLQITAQQATIQLRQVPAEALSQWLMQLRTSTQVRPLSLQLQRTPAPAQPAPSTRLPSPAPAPSPTPQSITSLLAPTGLQAGPSALQQIPNAQAAHLSVAQTIAPAQPVPAPSFPPTPIVETGVFWSGQISLALPAP